MGAGIRRVARSLVVVCVALGSVATATLTTEGIAAATSPSSGLVSFTPAGLGGNAASGSSGNRPIDLSADGRYVVFSSQASDLVAGDTNASEDVFLTDWVAGTVTRVSVDAGGSQPAAGLATSPSISADGDYVSFGTTTAFDPGDTNNAPDVYRKDLSTGAIELVSLSPAGTVLPGGTGYESEISGDGSRVVFVSQAMEVLVRDLTAGTTTRVDVAPDGSPNDGGDPDAYQTTGIGGISPNGRYVAFLSTGRNLIAGGLPVSACACIQSYVRDLQSGVTTLVSATAAGVAGDGDTRVDSVTDDGDVVLLTQAGSLGGPYAAVVRDFQTGVLTGGLGHGTFSVPTISASGRFVAFTSQDALVAGDTNGQADVYRFDRVSGGVEVVSVAEDGSQLDPSDYVFIGAISDSGLQVAFGAMATDADSVLLPPPNPLYAAQVFVRELDVSIPPPPPPPPSDGDGDGVDDVVEAGASGGDGNYDGTPDAQQANVASLPAAVGGGYATIAAPTGTSLAAVTAADGATLAPLPAGVILPNGVVGFTVHGVGTGATIQVEVRFDTGSYGDRYYKYAAGTWSELVGATVAGGVATLTLTDGGAGDGDGAADGQITDPGGPAVIASPPPQYDGVTRADTPGASFGQEGLVADVNGDGTDDLLVVTPKTQTVVARLAHDGAFTSVTSTVDFGPMNDYSALGPAVAVDVDDDGVLDIVSGMCHDFGSADPWCSDHDYPKIRGLGWAKGNGDGTFGDAEFLIVGNEALQGSRLVAGDFTGDGEEDLVTWGFEGPAIRPGEGAGFGDPLSIGLPANLSSVSLMERADLNDDAADDLVLAYLTTESEYYVVQVLGGATPSVGAPVQSALYVSVGGAWVGDLDDDGRDDLLVSQYVYDSGTDTWGHELTPIRSNGDGTFGSPGPATPSPVAGLTAALADITDDGLADLVVLVAGSPTLLQVAPGVGDGTFDAPITLGASSSMDQARIGDFDGDGDLDVRVVTYDAIFQPVDTVFMLDEATGPTDGDTDGVDDAVEAGAPNGGDGNLDGTADAQQANVSSLPAAVGGGYVTVASPTGTTLTAVTTADPATLAPLPAGVVLPDGVAGFTVLGVAPGASVAVDVTFHSGATPDSWFKYHGGVWSAFPGTSISGNVVTLVLVDGGAGDDDAVSGQVTDPGGPGEFSDVSVGPGTTELVSVTPSGESGHGDSSPNNVDFSADGNLVVFDSFANLVDDGLSQQPTVYVRDRVAGTTTRVSVTSSGETPPGYTGAPVISADGRYVAFFSQAPLDPAHTSAGTEVFRRDLTAGTTEQVSLTPGGTFGGKPAISGDGNLVAYTGYAAPSLGVFVRDFGTGTITRVDVSPSGDPSDGESIVRDISPNGRFVAFDSQGRNLLATPLPACTCYESYVRDLQTGVTTLVSATPSGQAGDGYSNTGSIANDGDVVITTDAPALGAPGQGGQIALIRDFATGALQSLGPNTANPSMSGDGRFVSFMRATDDSWATTQIYRLDRSTGSLELMSVAPDGSVAGAADNVGPSFVSDGGGDVAFVARAFGPGSILLPPPNQQFVSQVFVRDTDGPPPPPPDADGDGVPDSVEAGAPNYGDGNYDFVADAEQGNVVSLPAVVGGEYVTVAAPPDTALRDVATANPASMSPPAGVVFPQGIVGFRLIDVTPGGEATVSITFHGSGAHAQYFEYQGGAWSALTGAVIDGPVISLTLTDGAAGDGDSVPAQITHSSGPAYTPAPEGTVTNLSGGPDAASIQAAYSGNQSVSANGRYVVLDVQRTTPPYREVVIRDRDADGDGTYDETGPGGTSLITVDRAIGGGPADGGSFGPVISASGRYVAFSSTASNLVAGDTNNTVDAFVHDRDADADGVFDEPGETATVMISVRDDGSQPPAYANSPIVGSISDDGRYVSFTGGSYFDSRLTDDANSLRGVCSGNFPFVHDRDADGNGVFDEVDGFTTRSLNVAPGETTPNGCGFDVPVVSGDGNWAIFNSTASNLVAGDTNDSNDVFAVSLRTGGPPVRLSVSASGVEAPYASSGQLTVSADGRKVAWTTGASGLVDGVPLGGTQGAVVRDRDSDGDGVFDEPGGVTMVVGSVADDGSPSDDYSEFPSLSRDGTMLGFYSRSTNLTADPPNECWYPNYDKPWLGPVVVVCSELYVRDLVAGTTERVSTARANGAAYGTGQGAAFAANGDVAFTTDGALVADDVNGTTDVYVGHVTFSTPPDPDTDDDGVANEIDAGDGAWSDPIAGHETTVGSIVSAPPGVSVTVTDEPDPAGVRVAVTGSGGNATLSVCGGFSIQLAPGSEAVLTCASVVVQVVQGAATVVLADGVTVSVPEGVTAEVTDLGGGSYEVDVLAGSTGDATITANGHTSTVGVDTPPVTVTVVPPPDTTITAGPDEGSATRALTATVKFASTGTPATFECSVDGGAWSPCVTKVHLTNLTEGVHSVAVRSTVGGVTDPTPALRTWTVDRTDPVIDVAVPQADGVFPVGTTVNSSFSCDDPGGSGVVVCDGPPLVDTSTVGKPTFLVTATDAAGNTVKAKVKYRVVEPPETKLQQGPKEGDVVAVATASFNLASPGEPAATFECSLDGAPWAPCAEPVELSGLADGPHTLAARAVAYGLVDPTPATRSWTVDTVGPQIVVASPAEGATYAKNQVVVPSYSCTDPGGGGVKKCTGPATVGTGSKGAKTYVVKATDEAGNDSTTTVHYTVGP